MSLMVTRHVRLFSSILSQRRGGVLCFLRTLNKRYNSKAGTPATCQQVGFQTRLTFDEVKLPIAESFLRTHSEADHAFSIVHFHDHLVEQ